MPKKSFYLFLTSLLGMLLFLILHRIISFLFLYLAASDLINWDVNIQLFLLWDYFTLMVAIMLGSWYGIWLGLGWFGSVYEEKSHGGLVHNIVRTIFSNDHTNLRQKLVVAERQLEEDVARDVAVIDVIAQASWAAAVHRRHKAAVKRKVVRKKITKKV